MARFLVELPHTKEDCLEALDSVVAYSSALMERIDWGCGADVHTGWLVIEAQDEHAARMMVPTNIRDRASATQLVKFTPDQVRSFHDAH
jgi:hypothetical protein